MEKENTVEFPGKEETEAPVTEPTKIRGMAICDDCQTEYQFSIDAGGPDEIQIVCPKCGAKSEIGSYKTEVWLKEHIEKVAIDVFENTNIDGVMMICFNEDGYSMAGFGRNDQQRFEGGVLLKHIKTLMDVRGDIFKKEYDRLMATVKPGEKEIPQ